VKAVSIRLDNISKTFQHRVKGRVVAVNRVSLTVQPGELLTFLGPSGCGKTTTLRMVAGFEDPDEGRIFIGETDVTHLMVNRRNLGFVFQNYALFPHLSIYENIAYGLRVKGMPGAAMEQAVTDVLKLVGLEGYEHQFPNQLSGGEQQRVALARAIVIKPQVLLFDEPLSNLDAKLRVRTRSEIRHLQKSLQITSIYVTHDQEEAMAISDRIVVMNKGEIMQEGTAEELYFRPNCEFVAKFIGKINMMPAEVIEARGNTATLKIFDHTFRLSQVLPGVAAGQKPDVFVRPELVKLSNQIGPGRLTAVVTERTFLGEKIEYVLKIDGYAINATAYDPQQRDIFSPGQEVAIEFAETGIQILK
jgi:ABC-type Fe3+/spermidine/putrescine transport system ATPase subunit